MAATAPSATGVRAPDLGRERRVFTVFGVVQGVGFRPFTWTLAQRHALAGSVWNTSGAVVIDVEGPARRLDHFAADLVALAPPLARIDSVDVAVRPSQGAAGFQILESEAIAGEYQPLAADAATCTDCLRELFDPADRRHRYPFINCTGCGPRFTIIEDVPYDRARTTMRRFAMCAPCAAEYSDPSDRRFHAQPNACATCGPRAWLAGRDGVPVPGDAIATAAAALRDGAILAVKGLGGFQLAVVASDEAAVARLRARKQRPDKPFAVMVAGIASLHRLAAPDAVESRSLECAARPVVLLRTLPTAAEVIAAGVAPGLDEVGVMLPCTPLHHLLIDAAGVALVMTSGNLSDEPIAATNPEALRRLGGVADVFLLHDRDIAARYDDSVVRVVGGVEQVIRRARGYAPLPAAVTVPASTPPVLAVGAHLKNTFCILRDGRAFVGPHLGDLDHPDTRAHQDESLRTYLHLFRSTPTVVAADLHPDYASTQVAERWWDTGAGAVRVQHHHAHIASVMAEHHLRGPVIGVAFDGTGLGDDGTIWGGEFLLCDETGSRRLGHIAPVVQPGGDRCAREGWRMALAYLRAAGDDGPMPDWFRGAAGAPDERGWRLVGRVAAARDATTAPVSTSAGRLFDAVASLLGVAHHSSFEASAAMRLEALARSASRVIPLPVASRDEGGILCLDTVGLVAALVAGRRQGRDAADLAAVFHESLAAAVSAACADLAATTGVTTVALSGGVFQNALLLQRTMAMLGEAGLDARTNRSVPANDGGISLGQAYVAAWRSAAAG